MTESSTAGTGALRLGMFPLSTVLFPYAQMPLHVFEPAVPGTDGGLPGR